MDGMDGGWSWLGQLSQIEAWQTPGIAGEAFIQIWDLPSPHSSFTKSGPSMDLHTDKSDKYYVNYQEIKCYMFYFYPKNLHIIFTKHT